MTQVTEKELCCGCTACENVCPKKAISMKADSLGFLYPEINREKCVGCRLCVKVCPVNKKNPATNGIRTACALINNDENVRMESSSGGAFTLLAEKIINDGGVVFGAKFDGEFNVVHDFTEAKEELSEFRGSKYVQSHMNDCFSKCKEFLETGRIVLFTGTPCQCAGLRSFLERDYANLTVMDFICHGVPSPALWHKYKMHREKKSASRVVKTAFRRKNCGWKQYSLQFTFANCSEYCQPLNRDKYLQIFLHDTALRHSCYNCFAKGRSRFSDITVADFWGVEWVAPEFFDDRGTSLVCVNSERGARLFESVKLGCRFKEIDLDTAIGFNPSLTHSVSRPGVRDSLERDFQKMDIDSLYRKYGRDGLVLRMRRLLGRFARKTFGNKGVRMVKKLLGRGK